VLAAAVAVVAVRWARALPPRRHGAAGRGSSGGGANALTGGGVPSKRSVEEGRHGGPRGGGFPG
jgi:hypothetical protein